MSALGSSRIGILRSHGFCFSRLRIATENSDVLLTQGSKRSSVAPRWSGTPPAHEAVVPEAIRRTPPARRLLERVLGGGPPYSSRVANEVVREMRNAAAEEMKQLQSLLLVISKRAKHSGLRQTSALCRAALHTLILSRNGEGVEGVVTRQGQASSSICRSVPSCTSAT